jgi:hypothetical protein
MIDPNAVFSAPGLLDDAEGAAIDDRSLHWLLRMGIPIAAIAAPIAIRSTRARFHEDGRYSPSRLGEFVIVLPVPADPQTIITDLGVVELVAWSPKTGKIAARLGRVLGLGADQVGADGFGSTGLPIPVHRNPIGWLRAHRRGLVIADWNLAAFTLRGHLLEAEDAEHRRELLRRLTPVPPTIVVSCRRAAA